MGVGTNITLSADFSKERGKVGSVIIFLGLKTPKLAVMGFYYSSIDALESTSNRLSIELHYGQFGVFSYKTWQHWKIWLAFKKNFNFPSFWIGFYLFQIVALQIFIYTVSLESKSGIGSSLQISRKIENYSSYQIMERCMCFACSRYFCVSHCLANSKHRIIGFSFAR